MAYHSIQGTAHGRLDLLNRIKDFLVTTVGWSLHDDQSADALPYYVFKSVGESGAEDIYLQYRKDKIDFNRAAGIAVREYPTDSGPADYVLFVDRRPIGVIEAKRPEMGQNINVVAEQTAKYAAAKLKWIKDNQPLALLYESTGELTLFRDERDPKARSREVFWFHQPGTIGEWIPQPRTLRARLQNLPSQFTDGMRKVQVEAISRLEASFMAGRPRALIQMATGEGKTFTAITFIYRLLKYADARRILFLVDTKNLGEQAEQEFMAYLPGDDNRKFTELYNVQRLSSNYIADSSQVVISTIQRLYAILKGDPLDEAAEMENPAEHRISRKESLPVVYNPQLPIEYFDFIVIDECHRSIYNLWQQVLDYFDAFLVGLTATPDKRTFGFFHENVVSEYTHEQAVADGVNVGYDGYGLCLWRLGRFAEALRVFERMLWLNPTDNQGVRSLIDEVRAKTAGGNREND